MSSPAQASVTKTLGDVESEVAKSLIGGHTHSIASAVMKMKDVREAVFGTFKNTISNECRVLCQSSPNFTSQFRSIPVTKLADFTFVGLLEELEARAPTFTDLLTTIVTHRDHINKVKVGPAHYPGICTAAAILLKERNREMCGLQSLVSTMMYLCHCEKQVCINVCSNFC